MAQESFVIQLFLCPAMIFSIGFTWNCPFVSYFSQNIGQHIDKLAFLITKGTDNNT